MVSIVSQTHMLALFAMDSNMLANILDLERLFECFWIASTNLPIALILWYNIWFDKT